ncbi:hypothetical protein I5677_16720 [Mobilitalea sibirica]|uniref:Uncharacterized protein n=1 Tax=Mobilitalea sibirica TaxID=1462919 RepID=A0A8J7KY22_9FIRM|nr:hypothetical protein [Mobilitalea sibirica]MBH1942537.1 hypothetical protein [Mobilitalea sibirica]
MALNKSSKFGATDNLDFNINTQEVQHVQVERKEIGTTQGRKGQKLKRINMAFSDINHEYITIESRRRGISSTAFVNQIIDDYRKRS